MAKELRNPDHPITTEGSRPSPEGRPARKSVAIPGIVLVLVLLVVGIGYLVGYRGPSPTPGPAVRTSPSSAATTSGPTASASQSLPATSHVSAIPIPMSAACKWAYPGQASGTISGTGYAIVCLSTSGQTLGGFGGTHSLNAWCTIGTAGSGPELVGGTWVCSNAGEQLQPTSITPSQPAPATSAPGQPTPGPSASPSPSPRGGRVSVPIPMSAACKWAYPGQASGTVSGTGYAIVCLGTSGQTLGGFGGTHSLNAWCANPRHTNGKHAPDPALVKGVWVCTA